MASTRALHDPASSAGRMVIAELLGVDMSVLTTGARMVDR